MKHCLTIAGSDCSGGAGIQADLKAFSALGTFGMSVVTSVVAENTSRVLSIFDVPPESVAAQIDAVFEDIRVDAVKIGMLPSAAIIKTVAEQLRRYAPPFIVLDPVMVATSGGTLMQNEAVETLMTELFPLADLQTPNIPEAEAICGKKIETKADMEAAAKQICATGAKAVLIKGGHLTGEALDILYDGSAFHTFTHARIASTSTHGTGCTLSSAIAAYLARGCSLKEAVANAKSYVTEAIRHAEADIGRGNGPTNHFYDYYSLKGWDK